LVKRYKRFLADIVLDTGEEVTIHCPNTGSMRACISEGSDCWFSVSDNPKRKYSRTWEIATTPTGHLAGINSVRANNLVVEALEADVIDELMGYRSLKTEQRYGEEKSRIDILLSDREDDGRDCYVEVKSVTLLDEVDGRLQGFFPDAVSERGTKHLRELAAMVQAGQRAVLLFCVQHTGIESVAPAAHIDKKYTETLMWAVEQGVEVIAYKASITPAKIKITESLPVVLKVGESL
jgi:sugar fermentation stimulation protein A